MKHPSSYRYNYNISINNIILENFKIFRGTHLLEFADINIITGGNNSGKSSLLEFINLLSNGFASSHFPKIELALPNNKRKEFAQLINRESQKKEIGFGFKYKSKFLNAPLEVRYTFIDGSLFNEENTMLFNSLKLFYEKKNVFSLFKEHYNDKLNEYGDFYSSPNEGNNPGQFKFNMNVEFFSKLSAGIDDEGFSELFSYLFNKFGETWWGELFNEEEFNDISFTLDLNDLIMEFYRDREFNLADYNTRGIIQYSHPDSDKEYNKYELLSKELRYDDFVKNVLRPFFTELKNHLRQLFYTTLIKNDDTFQNAFIPARKETQYLNIIRLLFDADRDELFYYDIYSYNKFLHISLSLFDLHGIPEIEKHFNSGFTVNFVPTESLSDLDKGAFLKKINFLKNNHKSVNLSEMGSGTWSVFSIVLNTIASLIELDKLNTEDNKRNINKYDGTKAPSFRKTIMLQEPEAFLHPRWQSRLADFVVMCQNEFKLQFIIETHSEYFIRRLQYLTAQKKLKPEDLRIYYFSNPENLKKEEQQVRSLHIREDGLMDDDFGEGFFDESTRLTIDLLKLQNQN